MSFFKTVCFLSLLQGISGIDIPSTTTSSTLLLPRQLFGGGLGGALGAGLGGLGGCGLRFNVWGQISPLASSGHANLCLQCRINVLGIPLSFSFADALSTSINAYGVSASDAAVLQASIGNQLLQVAAGAKDSASCTAACSADTRCASSSFVGGSCSLKAVNYLSQNYAGGPLAKAFQGLFRAGGSDYCSICPSDNSCGPVPSGLPRRSTVSESPDKCPSESTACPLTPTTSFTDSTPFECVNVAEELTSCGGCATLGQGVDCSALPGVATSGCSNGNCKIFSCKRGYQYSETYKTCYKTHRASKSNL